MDIVVIIWSSINCPTVICSPTVCYFSREKPLVKPTAPGSSFSYIYLVIYFFLAFIFRSIKPKNKKIPCYNLFVPWSIYPIYKFTSRPLPILRRRTPKGIDNPFNTSGCEVLLLACRGCLRCVSWFSYYSITLVSYLREIPTTDVLHHPFLFGEIPK